MRRLFFDLDGTLLETSERYYRAFSDACSGLGVPVALGREEYWALKRDGAKDIDILRRQGVAEDVIARYAMLHADLIESPSHLASDVPHPAARGVLSELSSAYELVIVTARTRPDVLREQLARLSLAPFFSAVLTAPGRDAPIAEHKSAVVREHYPGPFHQCAFIGDSEADVEAGRTLGCKTIAVTHGIRSRERLRSAKPDHLADSLAEVRGLLFSDRP